MNLIAAADALVERVTRFERTRSLAKQAQAFRTRAEQLQAVAVEFDTLTLLRDAMIVCGITVPLEQPSWTGLAARAKKLSEAFEADANSIVAPQPALEPSFLTPLKTLSTGTRAQLTDIWRKHVELILGTVPEELLQVIEAVPELAGEVRDIRKLQADGNRIAATLPLPDVVSVGDSLAEVQRLSELKAEKLQSLRGIPNEVVHFLGLAASRRAGLGDLTAPIMQWLTEQNLLAAFRVVLG